MKRLGKTALVGMFTTALLCAAAASASAADIVRTYGASPIPGGPAPAIAQGVSVPPGFTTYYVSGALPRPVTPAANGAPADFGDMATQTRSVLDQLKATMAKMGIGFGDVVAAHVFLDPKADVAAMNKVWGEEFRHRGPAQPTGPRRLPHQRAGRPRRLAGDRVHRREEAVVPKS